ncbi:SDR family NAD(P)-dependent oxidoreductase, partial [Frankia sp. AiPs1]|uniref:SDR family NAD(P)-dependent oxidoreductase n=1 Tax=Frankia sp. AiPs1 TaxID=573493 RepID=UPI002044808D
MRERVAIVTGGGGGIGAEVSVELARRGATVVVLDSGDGLRGEPLGERSAERTVRRIEAAGGRAVAAPISVTDPDAVRGLVEETVARFGSLDIVVNAAGIVRFPRIADAAADDWAALLSVHLDGYLNMLAAALPRMTAAGYGRIVGVTSGVGLARTSVDGPAYGSAKRAVAALTWQLGPVLPAGVAVNALSPIAATRMVTEGLVAAGADPRGLDLSAMPQPAHMAPAAARLASEEFGWCRGRVLFSAGSELSLIAPPRLVEAVA